MKKSFFIIFLVCTIKLFAGPPLKTIVVTVVNECEWDVPVGLGYKVNMSRLEYWLDSEELEKFEMKSVLANGKIIFENVQAGVLDWSFMVYDETADRRQYEKYLEFLKDTVITISYNYEKMRYKWTIEEVK
jgi:hypothetical protein